MSLKFALTIQRTADIHDDQNMHKIVEEYNYDMVEDEL